VEQNPLLPRLRERIVRFAASKVSREAAEDVAQETMLVLLEKYSSVDRPDELVPLAIEIARLKIWGARRKAARRGEHRQVNVDSVPLSDGEADPFELAARRERLDHLETALRGLGERCRELFRLKLQGMKFPEIREVLKVDSLNTLYTWDFRCRKQLLEAMGGSWETPQSRPAEKAAAVARAVVAKDEHS